MTYSTTPLVVLADIHGNALALQAVLADAARRGLTRFVNLGDTFYGPLDPLSVWNILKDMDIPSILGNQDRVLIEGGPEWESLPAYRTAVEALGDDGMNWLRSLPATRELDKEILLCHGTPSNDCAYLLEDVSTGLPAMRSCSDIESDLFPVAYGCSLVLAGHSHHQGLVRCNGTTVVNPGSVGLPAYDDDTPPHIMASGSPHAKYAVISHSDDTWEVEFVSVEYDWESASRMAADNGREDWAQWLATGMA